MWKNTAIIFGLCIVVVVAAAYLGYIPTEIRYFPYYDTVGHAVLAGVLSYLVYRATDRKVIHGVPFGPLCVLALFVAEEFLQTQSSLRTFSYYDIAADVIGIALLLLLDWIFLKDKPNA